ncbi:MAG: transcription initiation factor IIB [Candidatus Njordarchaeia archaeon]|nr:hypothetical protein [Candidatus Korarchaeota archaeon]
MSYYSDSIADLNKDEKLVCPYCGSEDIELIGDKYVCMRCGSIVKEEIIDTGPEDRVFKPEEALKRRFAPTSSFTGIQPHRLYIEGESIGSSRLIPKDARTRNTMFAMSILNELANRMYLSRIVRDTVLEYYRRLSIKRSIRRERVPAIVAALVYIACRIAGVPRPLDKIARISNIRKKDISKAYKMVKEELKILVPVPDPEKFVVSFGKELRLSGEIIYKALDIIRRVKKMGVSIGRDPAGIAAAALYIATRAMGEKKTQKKVAEVAGVTEVTVRNRYREIVKLLNMSMG